MRAPLLTALLLLATGCNVSPADVGALPACPKSDDVSHTVILIAQAVPTAQLVPCVATLPSGWTVFDIEVRDGHAQIDLSADDMGTIAVSVTLTSSCDLTDATSVPSDREGTRRYDVEPGDTSPLDSIRRYVFDGGCATYSFDQRSTEREVPVEEALLAVPLLSRDVVREAVRVSYDDRVELDPASDPATR